MKENDLLSTCIEYVKSLEKVSCATLQKKFTLGYNQGGRIMDELERRGIVGPFEGSKERRVLIKHKMKLFTATVEASNTCYVETFLIIALDIPRANELLVDKRVKQDRNKYLIFKHPITEVPIKIIEEKERIESVWWGHNEDKNSGHHDD